MRNAIQNPSMNGKAENTPCFLIHVHIERKLNGDFGQV